MNLPPNSLLFGVAPFILIDCAAKLRPNERPFSIKEFCAAIGAPEREARPVLDQMLAAGIVKVDEHISNQFISTSKLSQLALASISVGISRGKAEQLLQTILRKIDEINADPLKFPYAVDCLVVFGSYLSTKPVLGDLDLGVQLREPSLPKDKRKPIEERLKDHYAGCNKTAAALRLRKPKLISLHALEEVVALGTPYKVIWGQFPDRYTVT